MNIKGNFETRQVFIDGKPLSSKYSQSIINHSPDGFMWGYAGSGPAQLALAIILTRTDKEHALPIYQMFKFAHIANLPNSDFNIDVDVDGFITKNGGLIKPNNNWIGVDKEGDNELPSCGIFYARCINATSDKCQCNCGGENHGIAKRIT